MNEDVESLSDRERQALRLLGQGHEAKSIATALGLSVHTVNERLRAARRKLGVSSSREAARLLLAHEQGQERPKKSGYKEIGVALPQAENMHPTGARSGASGPGRPLIHAALGGIMLVALISVLMTIPLAGNDATPPSGTARTAEAVHTLPSLFTATDYPAEALAKGVQGSTQFRLLVSDIGRVEKCTVERSSGSAALDQATCRVIRSRARFRPAVDTAGRPVASDFTGSIEWMLGDGA